MRKFRLQEKKSMNQNLHQIAEQLDKAATNAHATPQISKHRDLTLEEAYAIQSISLGRRYLRGEKMTGLKLGFTSKAKMEQMGVHDMIWGQLTNAMHIAKGGELEMQAQIHPRVEPEIAFRFSKDIVEPISLENAKEFVDAVALAIEVIDSRYENFKFSLADVIADNCSSSGYCLGNWMPVDHQVNSLAISLSLDDVVQHSGNTNAILGNPWESVVHAVRLALSHGIEIKKGHVLLAGAATAAVFVHTGNQVKVTCEGFESIGFTVK